jgi:malonyl CoA-acyl carrier protein transacylase
MGAALLDQYADWTAEADRCLGYSIRELCVSDPRGELGLTRFTQPALYVVNALTYRARAESGAAPPDFVAGHSLGEFNALLAAGVFDFPTGLRLVRRRGEIMSEVAGGGMAAIVGVEPARIREILDASEVGQRLDVANFNSFDQTVIAGKKDDLVAVRPDFESAGVRAFIPLKVSAPFHSRYMQEAQREFQSLLDETPFGTPSIPVVANVTGKPYDPDSVRETLSAQIGSSVRWLDSMLFLFERPEPAFEEIGPGTVLTKLVAQIRKKLGR